MNDSKTPVTGPGRSLSQLVEKACRHWETRQQATAAQPNLPPRVTRAFTIALEREVGTQGSLVAQEVGKLLGWHVYDHELLEHIAREMGLRTVLLKSVDEREQSWMTEATEAFLSVPLKSEWGPLVDESGFVHHLIKTVLALSTHGECIIVGRGAAFVVPVETTLRVRLVGSIRERIAVQSRRFGVSEREAARQVRTLDRERTDFVHDHFLQDPNDPRNYDLVLNAPRLSVVQCAEMIVEMLHCLEARRKEANAGTASS